MENMEDLFVHIATKLHFGIDTISLLGVTAADTGSRIMLVYDPILQNNGILEKAVTSLEEAGISPLMFDEAGPFSTSRSIERGIELARKGQVQCIIGLGGVSTLSNAKAIAGFMKTHELLDPVFGMNEVDVDPVFFIGVPTSFRDSFMLTPRVLLIDARNRISKIVSMKNFSTHTIIMDPSLCEYLSPGIVRSTIIEILMQNMEGYFSTASNFITHSLFLRSIDICLEILNGINKEKSEGITLKACQAGLLSGLGFSMARLGFAAAIAYSVNGLHQVPSSSISTLLLPYLLEYARDVCPDKLLRIGPIINPETRNKEHGEAVDLIIDSLRLLLGTLDLPMRLSQYDIQTHHLALIARTAADIGVMGYLPMPLTIDELMVILKKAL